VEEVIVDKDYYIANQTSVNVSQTYTICAYPLSTCSVDPVNYEEKLNDILTTLPTNNTFYEVLNVVVVPEFTLSQNSNTAAPSAPTISNIVSSSGSISLNAVSSSSIVCFVKILESAPTSAEFDTCGSDCSVVYISSTSATYSINTSAASNSNIYAVCYNDAHCSSLGTDVINIGTYSYTSGNTDTNSTTNTTTNNTTSSSYIKYCMLLLAFLYLALLE